MSIKALLFDFDGVILDSLNVKTQAFYNMYLPYGIDVAQKAANHHLEHGGVSRFEKFRIYHKDFLGIDLTEEDIGKLADEFSERVLRGVIESPEVLGIRAALEHLKQHYRMWVITGTPTTEIKIIADATNFTHYFVELYGSPEKKDFWTKKIISEENLKPEEVVFIGDATTDYDAAMANHTHFILREHADNLSYFENKDLVRIKDFTSFTEVLKRF